MGAITGVCRMAEAPGTFDPRGPSGRHHERNGAVVHSSGALCRGTATQIQNGGCRLLPGSALCARRDSVARFLPKWCPSVNRHRSNHPAGHDYLHDLGADAFAIAYRASLALPSQLK